MTQIPAFNPADSALRPASANRFGEMKTEDFIRIIFTELSNQDPFSPNDSAALLEQLNSIRSIESDLQLTQQLQALVLENQLASAGNLIGRTVVGLTEGGVRVDGLVVAAHRHGDGVHLELDSGWTIPMGNVESIVDLPTSGAADSGAISS